MIHGGRPGARFAAAAGLITFLLGVDPGTVIAGTTGKISGQVLDPQKKPVVAATVLVVGERLGAITDGEGKYNILKVPPGTYEITVSRLGFSKKTFRDVIVSADNTTWLDVALGDAAVQMEEVVVTAERPSIEVNQTGTRQVLTSEQIEALPVQDLQDVVNLQAGVVDGHFRGGRSGEVQYQVDGISINNSFDNAPSLKLDRSLLQEVQVISGTFDAEYGQAMSGVVNAVLKDGTPKFRWEGEAFTGSFVFPGAESRRLTSDELRPAGVQNYQLTVMGPTPLPGTVYLLSGRRYHYDDFVIGRRTFVPTDSSDFENKIWKPTGDGSEEPLGFSREWSGVGKLTNTSIKDTRLSYQALFNVINGRRGSFAYRYNPDGLSRQRTVSLTHGLDMTRSLSGSTFLDFSFRQIYFDYHDRAFEDAFDPRYDEAGPPLSDPNFEEGTVIQGVNLTRYIQKTNTILFKSSVVSQVTAEHQVKVGGEIHFPKVSFGSPEYLTFSSVDGRQTLVRHINEPPDFPAVATYTPIIAAAHAQDQAEWRDLTLRAGLRLDYFDARTTVPGDLANPANAIEGAPESRPRDTTARAALAPRLGVAYPIEDKAALHFSYGHFYQYPAIGTAFTNADYSVLANLQAGGISYGVLGNPDVKPEKTVQYEFGYKHALSPDIGLDVSLFYKDIRDLLGVEFVSTYNGAEYARLTNVDFGSVVGLTVAVDDRNFGPVSVGLDYTWQQARGNSSDPRETATRASAGEDPRPRLTPFNWDQRHTLNLTVSFADARGFTASGVLRAGSGQPYTPQIESGFGFGLDTNSGRKPTGAVVDLRASQSMQWQGLDLSLFGRVFNAFDTRYFNGFVFSSTGSPYYSRFPVADSVTLRDPTRYYQPRRVEIGLKFTPGNRTTDEEVRG